MAQADSNYTTKPSALIHDPLTNRTHESNTGDCGGMFSVTRRSIMNSLVALPIVTALPVAAPAMTATSEDRELLKLEEQIFEQYEAAGQYDEEIRRLHDIWLAEGNRLYDEVRAGRSTLTSQERWDLVSAMPESIESGRLVDLQDVHVTKMDALLTEMFA